VFVVVLAVALLLACADKATPGNSLPEVLYEFVKESGGTAPNGGTVVLLGFEYDGTAFLYAAMPGHVLAYHGSWSYAHGEVSLNFASPEFSLNSRFPLSLSQTHVTMPFQVFAGKPGQSEWERKSLDPVTGMLAVYYAAIANHSLNLEQDAASNRALSYARSRLGASRKSDQDARLSPFPEGALQIRRELVKANPQAYLPKVAMTIDSLSVLYKANGQNAKANDACAEATAVLKQAATTQPAENAQTRLQCIAQ
jgi:hypothetical protein